MASGSVDNTIQYAKFHTSHGFTVIPSSPSDISPPCRWVLAARLYNLSGGVANSIIHVGKVFALQMRDDSLFSGGSSGKIYRYSVVDNKVISIFPGHDESVNSLSADWAHNMIVSGGSDKTIKMWDMRGPPDTQIMVPGHSASVTAVSLYENTLVSSSRASTGELFVWDLRKVGSSANSNSASTSTALVSRLASSTSGTIKSSMYDGVKLLSSAERESCVR